MKALLKKGSTYKKLEKLDNGMTFITSRDLIGSVYGDDFEVENYDTVTLIKFEDAINELIKSGYKLKSITIL